MKTVVAVLLCSAVLGMGVHVTGQVGPDTTTFSMRGTLERYDPATRTLSVMTRRGTVDLRLVTTTRIRRGRHEIDEMALEKLTGYRAVVRYSEAIDSRILQSIHVLDKGDTPRK